MRDGEIRGALADRLHSLHARDTDTVYRHELGLCLGETRVDMAAINGAIRGYEIKSGQDTLARLPGQIEIYGRVLDYVTIVAEGRHLARVDERVPEWWGVWEAVEKDGVPRVVQRRPARMNRRIDPLSVAQLLWRDEALAALETRGEAGMRRATRWDLWDRLAAWPIHRLRSEVRHRLKIRTDWPGG